MSLKQSQWGSFLESLGSTALGFGLGLAGQAVYLMWWKGLPMTLQDNFEFAAVMTIVSVARGYGWRRLMERFHVRAKLSPAMQAVIAERLRQKSDEGFDDAHDDSHTPGELATAGSAYLLTARGAAVGGMPVEPLDVFPWPPDEWWKPADIRRNLVKGCALGLAELERFDRGRKRRPISAAQRSPQ